LNVSWEIQRIKLTIDEVRYEIEELRHLRLDIRDNVLQEFINAAVDYAEVRENVDSESSQVASSSRDENTKPVKESIRSTLVPITVAKKGKEFSPFETPEKKTGPPTPRSSEPTSQTKESTGGARHKTYITQSKPASPTSKAVEESETFPDAISFGEAES